MEIINLNINPTTKVIFKEKNMEYAIKNLK
jgi:hypothetical protein